MHSDLQNILTLLSDIKERLDQPQDTKIVVDVEEIGAMFGRKKGTGYRIIKSAGFPAPVHVEGAISRVWLKEDVEKWARSVQIRNERIIAA